MGTFVLVLLMPLAISLKIASRLLQPMDDRSRVGWYQMLEQISHLLMLIALFSVVIAFTGMLGVVIVPLAIATLLMHIDRLRRAEHESLVGLLAISAEQGVPIVDAAKAMQSESQSDLSQRAGAMAQAFVLGMNLEQAVKRARLRLSTSSRLAVSFGGRLGSVSPILSLQNSLVAPVSQQLRSIALQLILIFGQLLICLIGIGLYFLRVLPVQPKLIAELGLKSPAALDSLIGIARRIELFPLPVLLVVFAFTALVTIYIGWMPRDALFLGVFTRRYDSAIVLAGLRHGVQLGRPLDQTLLMLSEVYPMKSIRRRLVKAQKEVVSGSNWTKALCQTGLLRKADAALLESAERVGNLSWALHAVSESLLRRSLQSAQRISQVIWPIAVILLGSLVFLISLSVFQLLAQMVQGLA